MKTAVGGRLLAVPLGGCMLGYCSGPGTCSPALAPRPSVGAQQRSCRRLLARGGRWRARRGRQPAAYCASAGGTFEMSSWSSWGTDRTTRPCSLARCSTQMKHRCTAGRAGDRQGEGRCEGADVTVVCLCEEDGHGAAGACRACVLLPAWRAAAGRAGSPDRSSSLPAALRSGTVLSTSCGSGQRWGWQGPWE